MPAIRRKTRIVPVLDIKEGCVVRAVKGLRADYRPLKSALVSSSEPQVVAEALLKASGAEELYVADLDAILGGDINGLVLNRILELCPFPVWLDGGFGIQRSRVVRTTSRASGNRF
jgi:phosphoribosylformimino-5-aminoimidazole carboxamide ribotide isomerase